MQRNCWAILTGEYPPQPGGVSDYTHRLAHGLANAGDEVHVWAPHCTASGSDEPGVTVHRLADHFGRRGLPWLTQELRKLNRPYHLLVEYTPHAYGCKAMNVRFCRWLSKQKTRPWVHFHEVAYPYEQGQRWRHRLLAAVTHRMAKVTARSASRIFVTTPAWEALIQHLIGPVPMIWLGASSNLPTAANESHVREIRTRIGPDRQVIGHFGTFGPSIASMLQAVLPRILTTQPQSHALLIGRGGTEFARQLAKAHPQLAARITATGQVEAQHAADSVSACDVLLQPFPDGLTARRSSLMAGMALGRAIVTTTGPLTESYWSSQGAVVLCDTSEQVISQVTRLLADRAARDDLGDRARRAYAQTFAIERTIATLRAAAAEDAPS